MKVHSHTEAFVELRANDAGVYLGHEVLTKATARACPAGLQQGHTCLGVQITSVSKLQTLQQAPGQPYSAVSEITLFISYSFLSTAARNTCDQQLSGDGVGNERRLMKGLVVGALGLHAHLSGSFRNCKAS